MATRTIKTRILIISDTHCAPLRDSPDNTSPFKAPLPEADLLIHCGDLTKCGRDFEYELALDLLGKIHAPLKLVIAGNHDLTLDRAFVSAHAKSHTLELHHAARQLWTSSAGRATAENIAFLDEGTHDLRLPNGARLRLYASPYTPKFYDWAFMYDRDDDRFNPPGKGCVDSNSVAEQAVPGFAGDKGEAVDVMVTHGPPWQRLDRTFAGDSAGCWHVWRGVCRARPMLHCFGHIHEGWGAEKVRFSEKVDEVLERGMTMEEWKEKGWKAAVESIERIEVDMEKVRERHAAVVDLSGENNALQRGRETMFVNASIMDVRYRPSNAAWLIELDLPAAT